MSGFCLYQKNGYLGWASRTSWAVKFRPHEPVCFCADDYPFILAKPLPLLSTQRSLDHHLSHVLTPQPSLDQPSSLDDDLSRMSPFCQPSRLAFVRDWTKVTSSVDSDSPRFDELPQLHGASGFPKAVLGKLDKGALLRRRPGATRIEVLQVRIQLQFLIGSGSGGMEILQDNPWEPRSIRGSILTTPTRY